MLIEKKDLIVFISREQIKTRIKEMGEKITADYKGQKLTVIGALKGCFMFMADLIRQIDLELYVEFIEVSSYGNKTKSSGVVRITKDFKFSIEGENVLIIEDIIDTGLTLNFLMDSFFLHRPNSLRVASLLIKEEKQKFKYPIDYRGFNIEDKFVIGYGMDYKGFYRNLDYITYLNASQT